MKLFDRADRAAFAAIGVLEAENAALWKRAEKAEAALKAALDKINQQLLMIAELNLQLKEKNHERSA